MSRREYLDKLNVEYTPIDADKSEALQRELGGIPIAVTLKGIFRLFHNGIPHYFIRLDDAVEFWRFCQGKQGSGRGA
jgi:hypothetical protein